MNTRFHFHWRKALLTTTTASLLLFLVAAAPQHGTIERVSGAVRLVQNRPGEARLLLGFADRSGLYLANVLVHIKDQTGHHIAELIAEGPWLDLQMSPGTYHVTAVFDGEAQELRDIRLDNRATITHVLYWDLKVPSPEMMAYSQAPAIG